MNKKYLDVAINWYGDITSISGNSQYARNFIKYLIQNGASVRIFPIQPQAPVARLDEWWEKHLNLLVNSNQGYVDIYHGNPQGFDRSNRSFNKSVILTNWESTMVPISWQNTINEKYNQLWVTNKGAYSSALNSGIEIPIKYARPGVDFESLSNDKLSIVGINDNTLVFGAVGVWNNRKNFSDLIISYSSEFIESDNVCLVIKTCGSSPNDPNEKVRIVNLVRELRKNINNPSFPPIVLLQDLYSYDTMNAIINRFDIYVSTSRGESKAFPLLYSMYKGKPCIIPYDTHINSDIINFNSKYKSEILYHYGTVAEPIIQMGTVYSSRDYWSRPNTADLSQKMKQAFSDYLTKDLRSESIKQSLLAKENFNIDICVDQFAENCKNIIKDVLVKI